MRTEDALLESAAVLLSSPDLQDAIEGLAGLIGRRCAIARLGVAVVQPDESWLRVLEAFGDGPASRGGGKMPRDGTANGSVVETGRPHVNLELATDGDLLEEQRLRSSGSTAYLCLPARFGGTVLGTLNIALSRPPTDATALVHDLERLGDLLGAALERERLQGQVRRLTDALRRRSEALAKDLDRLGGMRPVAHSAAFRSALDQTERVAVTDASVLLLGETGTGKEILARHLHAWSPRATGPFVPVNCAALPDGLVESELFGHRRGAFTGAEQDRAGVFELASGGTLFLDEIGELPPGAQAKLLRVLQDGMLTPVGATRPIHVDVRVVAATHNDLPTRIEDGSFRADLWHRLATFPIRVPTLQQRREDVPHLVREFVRSACERTSRPPPKISDGILQILAERDWPGNVRELRNLVERALVFSEEVLVLPPDELPHIGDSRASERVDGTLASSWPTLADAQRAHVRATLAVTDGRVYGKGGAADLLGLPSSTLKSRMKKLGLA